MSILRLASDADHEVATLANFSTREAAQAADDHIASWGLGSSFQFAELAGLSFSPTGQHYQQHRQIAVSAVYTVV